MTEPSPQPSRAAGGRGAQILSFIAGVLVVLAAVWIIQKVREPKSAPPVPDQTAQTQTFPIPSEPPTGANEESAELKAMPRISVADAQSELSSGKAALIDVRDAEDYLALHAAGAMHIPLRYIQGEAQYLPRDKNIILYCT